MQILGYILKDVSAFILNMTCNEPHKFSTDVFLSITLRHSGGATTTRSIPTSEYEDLVNMIQEVTAREEEVLWKSTNDGPHFSFLDILNDAMLPPPGHECPFEPGQARRYVFDNHVSYHHINYGPWLILSSF